jgi:hypothetical protein
VESASASPSTPTPPTHHSLSASPSSSAASAPGVYSVAVREDVKPGESITVALPYHCEGDVDKCPSNLMPAGFAVSVKSLFDVSTKGSDKGAAQDFTFSLGCFVKGEGIKPSAHIYVVKSGKVDTTIEVKQHVVCPNDKSGEAVVVVTNDLGEDQGPAEKKKAEEHVLRVSAVVQYSMANVEKESHPQVRRKVVIALLAIVFIAGGVYVFLQFRKRQRHLRLSAALNEDFNEFEESEFDPID